MTLQQTLRTRLLPLLSGAALLTTSLSAHAADEPSALPKSAAQSAPVFQAFKVFAEDEKARRLSRSAGGVILGGGTIGVGGILAATTDTDAKPFYIIGGVTAGLSLLGFFIPSPAETLWAQSGTMSAETFENKWQAAVVEARKKRFTSSIVGFTLGAGSVTAGAVIAAGAGKMSDDDRATWGGVLVGSGAALFTIGLTSLFVRSPIESSFAEFKAGQGTSSNELNLAFSAIPAGGGLHLQGGF